MKSYFSYIASAYGIVFLCLGITAWASVRRASVVRRQLRRDAQDNEG